MGERYYRVCTKLNDKGILVKKGYDFDSLKNGEAYVSAYQYNEKHKKQFDETGSVAGIEDTTGNIIYFDLDNQDIEIARKDTITVLSRLKKYGINSDMLKIHFSGRKGFNIAINTTKLFKPEEARALAIKIAGDLQSFDSSIYNANRIIRLEGSIHKATNLRKTQITEDELKTFKIEDIKDLAKDEYEYQKSKKIDLSDDFMKLTQPILERKKEEATSMVEGVDYLSNPLRLTPRVLAISQGFFPNGQRSNALMILATNIKNKGLTKKQCHYYLKAAADHQSEKYNSEKFSKEEIWNNIVEQIYKPTWKGGQYTEENYPIQLAQYFEELGVPKKEFSNVANSLVSIDESYDEFIDYAVKIDEHIMPFGIPSLDERLKPKKGELFGVLAPPGCGKTSLGITILNNCSKRKAKCVFFSFDMYKFNVIKKLIQRHTGLDEDTIFDYYRTQDKEKMKEFKKILKDNYENVSFCFQSGQSIKEMKNTLYMKEAELGEKADLVVVDYLELISTEYSDPTASSAEAINGLREIANEGRVVIVLLQPNKMSSKPNQPLLTYNASKGSSMIGQAVTAMITAHRPGMSSQNPENDKFFSVNIVKNRSGALFSLDFAWEGRTQIIRELTAEQKFELKVLRDTMDDSEEDDF